MAKYKKALAKWNRASKKALAKWNRAREHEVPQIRFTLEREFLIDKPMLPLAAWNECQDDPLVIQWIGISVDETNRMKQSREPWAKHIWPLVELRISRSGCLKWMDDNGHPQPPRSACFFCPFHDNEEWERMRTEEPVQFERAVQSAKARSENIESVPYLHRSCKPLDTIDFRSDFEKGQLSLWQNECEGMCGI